MVSVRSIDPPNFEGHQLEKLQGWAAKVDGELFAFRAAIWEQNKTYLEQLQERIAQRLASSGVTIESPSGDAMRDGVAPLVKFVEASARLTGQEAQLLNEQADASKKLPPAVPMDVVHVPEENWFAGRAEDLGLYTTDNTVQTEKKEAFRQEAIGAFNNYYGDSQLAAQKTPNFSPPPPTAQGGVVIGDGSGSGSGSSGSTSGSGSTVGGAGGRYEGAGDTNPYMPGTQLPGQPGSLVPGNASGTNAANAATLPASQTPGVAGQPGAGPGNGPGYGVPGGPLGGMTGSGGGGRGGSSSGGGRGSTGARPVGNLSPGANPGAGGKGGPGSGAGAKGGLPGQVGSGGAKSGSPGMYPPGHPLARNGKNDNEHETDENLKEPAYPDDNSGMFSPPPVIKAILGKDTEPPPRIDQAQTETNPEEESGLQGLV